MSHHIIIPWASALAPGWQDALGRLQAMEQQGELPNLLMLRTVLRLSSHWRSDEYAPHLPHEVLWASAMGWLPEKPEAPPPGPIPTGAWLAFTAGLTGAAGASDEPEGWGIITPCHWSMGHDSLTMQPPEQLNLDATASRELFDAAYPWFESSGWTLHWVNPLQWLVCHPSLASFTAASLDRVIGRNPDVWLPDHELARPIRRLQAEMQMLWYQHPINAQRELAGEWPVNSFWLSGCGAVPATGLTPPPDGLIMPDILRGPMLTQDTNAWLQGWKALDASVLAQAVSAVNAGQAIRLSLCGERHALTLASSAPATSERTRWWAGWRGLFKPGHARPTPLAACLTDL